jgi:hypothetical protein
MEGKFLPPGFANNKDAFVLRRTIRHDRDQLHVSPDSHAEDDRKLESANPGEISFRFKSATENHALGKIARLRQHAGLFLQSDN